MINLSIPLRNARLQAIADAVGAAGGEPLLTLYPGTQPAQTADPAGQDPLVALPVPLPFADSITSGVLTGKPLPETMAMATGTATWARLTDGAGVAVMDLEVGEDDAEGNPTAPVSLPSASIYEGMLVTGVSVTFTEG